MNTLYIPILTTLVHFQERKNKLTRADDIWEYNPRFRSIKKKPSRSGNLADIQRKDLQNNAPGPIFRLFPSVFFYLYVALK